MGSALLSVIFCLDFIPFFFSSLVPLPSVFPLFIYLGYAKNHYIEHDSCVYTHLENHLVH